MWGFSLSLLPAVRPTPCEDAVQSMQRSILHAQQGASHHQVIEYMQWKLDRQK